MLHALRGTDAHATATTGRRATYVQEEGLSAPTKVVGSASNGGKQGLARCSEAGCRGEARLHHDVVLDGRLHGHAV